MQVLQEETWSEVLHQVWAGVLCSVLQGKSIVPKLLVWTVGYAQDAKEMCAECGDKISEDHISCNSKVYHPLCMKCQVCGEVIREKFLTYKDRPICEKDFRVSGWLPMVSEPFCKMS